jgi:hypothetical protein
LPRYDYTTRFVGAFITRAIIVTASTIPSFIIVFIVV